MHNLNQQRWQELKQVKASGGGLLKPERVVEFARDPATALHSHFTWDDSEAAQKWRVEEARALIRVMIETLPEAKEPVRLVVSVMEDRKLAGGGYRNMEEVMHDPVLRQKYLDTCLAELNSTRKRYKALTELAHVFSAIDAAQEQHSTAEMAA